MGSVKTIVTGSCSLLLLIAVGFGCAAGGRGFGEACAVTADCHAEFACIMSKCDNPGACSGAGSACSKPADCCTSFTCQAGHCAIPAPHCGDAKCDPGETSLTCCRDCGCATGQICQANKCMAKTTGPVCGNRKCEAGETSANCCADCGCAAGQTCQGNVCKAPTGTVLTWTITNNCPSDQDVEFRFFAEDRGLEWPGGNLVYTLGYGDTASQPLSCVAGEQVCIGGDLPGEGLVWGVDIDNSGTCTDCCFTCANASAPYSFDCP